MPPPARAVHADGVHLVDVGHCAIAVGEIANRLGRRNVAVHGIQALEHDQLRPLAGATQQFLKVANVVVAEDALLAV